jgi:LPXTG-motif cell wall-anchored protein
MPDPEVIEVVDEPIPAGPLPQTGGFPALALIGIGGLLAATGTGLKLRKKT